MSEAVTRLQGFDGKNNKWVNAWLDSITHALESINHEHHEIHTGNHFFFADFVALENGNTLDIGIQTANTTKWAHFVFLVASTLGSQVQVYEGASITFDGTDITAHNNNRNSATTTNIVNLEKDPTVVSVGTLIAQSQLGSSSNPNQGLPGAGERNREIILKQNETYLIRITSLNNSNIISYLAEWYELTSKS